MSLPESRKWRSLDFFGSLENLHLPYHPHKHGHKTEHKQEGRQDKHSDGHQKSSFRARLSSLSDKNELKRDDWDGSGVGLVQRCVIIQKDEKGYGLTVSGDNPVYVASVKPEGAAAKAGVQKDDRIVKVNGTLVTKCNHIDVVKLIKSGSYVALTLMGRPNPSSPNAASSANSAFLSSANTLSTPATISNRSSVITAPQPVDPDKDRELWVQKLHMTQAMHDQAKEDFEKLQRQYVRTPTERLHTNLLEKERTVKTLEKQLQQLKVFEEDFAGSSFGQGVPHYQDSSITSAGSISSISSWRGDSKHVKQASVPVSLYKSSGEGAGLGPDARAATHVMRSKSDVASRRNRAGLTQSTFYVSISQAAGTGCEGGKGIRRKLKRWKSYSSSLYQRPSESSLGLEQPPCQQPPQATSQPVSDAGSMSDSPQTSPSVSPTPLHPANQHDAGDTSSIYSRNYSVVEDQAPVSADIITIDDEDVNSEEEQVVDTGPFSDIRQLEKKPAYMAVLLHYMICNSDPACVFFHIVTEAFKQATGSAKDLRKWGYEIFSTFIAPKAPLKIPVEDTSVMEVNNILLASANRGENEAGLRAMFDLCRFGINNDLVEQLADFRNKRDLGLGNMFGVHELRENMDKSTELKMVEKYLMPHLIRCTQEDVGLPLSDREQAMAWALATFFRQVGIPKTSPNSAILERVQSFIMKDKRSLKFPGSRSSRAKVVKNHQFNLQHFYIPTYCSECSGLIWGVGYQGFLCQSCDLTVHKQCVEEMVEVCGGKKRGAGKRASAFIPVLNPRKPGSIANQLTDFLGQGVQPDARSPPHTVQDGGYASTQPVRKEDDPELAGISTEHSVRSIINRYEMASPTGPGPGQGDDTKNSRDRKGSADLSRSESLKGKGEKGDRPARRAKSDVDKDEMFRAINQSGSSSASSLSNRSAESPSTSSEYVNDSVAKTEDDSDFEVEELPSLKQVLGEEVLKKLKPKEKKRQEVINELFHTERAHLRNLKVLDRLFYRQMLSEGGGVIKVLAQALFPNIDEIISLHASMNKQMKERRPPNGPVEDVGDILLSRFDNEDGETFRKACAEYCRNQAYALEELKKQKRKEQRLSLLLYEAEASPLCRKLELKDIVPCQMQRLTKYPMLIENLMKYTSTTSQEYPRLERALERSKHILAYVNQAIRECENYHKLRDMQKRLDCRAIDSSTDPNLTGFKALDLTKHKLVYDGPLVWRLRSHRQIELQVLLLEDILVLLQRVDDKLVLKCQSTNTQTSGTEYKYTHSPVLKLQNLLARNVATDKRAFFVINTSDTGPQIYEFAAPSADARKMWCKHINEKAEEIKKIEKHIGRRPQMLPTDEVTVRNRVYGSSATPPPSEVQAVEAVPKPSQSVPEEEGIIATPATEYPSVLIQPDQISVSGAVTTQATPVLSPFERLRRNDQLIESALSEKEKLVAEVLHLSQKQYHHLSQREMTSLDEDEYAEQSLIISGIQTCNGLIQLISSCASSLASVPEQHGSLTSPGTQTSSHPDLTSTPSHQEQKATVPVPMDQLRNMAQDMNSILSNLLTVMNTRGAERQSLRQELKAAQDQLDMLKAIQKQMLFGPGTSPKSRPDSFISMTSSISETGEATDSEQTEDDSGSVLKVAQTQVLAQEELVEAVVETVTSLEAKVQPQLALAAPVPHQQNMEDDSDDGYEMIPRNLPLPDDASVRSDMTVEVAGEEECSSSSAVDETLSQISTFSTSSSETVTVVPSVPMTTDLDEGVEDGPSTPTPSPTSVAMTTVSEGSELGEQRDSDLEGMDVDDASMTPARDSSGEDPSVHSVGLDNNVEEKTDGSFQQVDNQANNNNTSSLNADMTVPIEI